MPISIDICLILLALSASYLFGKSILQRWNLKPLPPGPKSLPLIGCLPQLLFSDLDKTLREWHKTFGPLISFKVATKTIISIGSHELGKELLDKRGSIYSSRPAMTFLRNATTKNLQPALLPYGPRWKLLHRVQSVFLSQGAIQAYYPLQELESLQLVRELLSRPAVSPCVDRFGTSLMFSLIFGKRLPEGNEKVSQRFADLIATKVKLFQWIPFLVEVFPVLQYLPERIAKWKTLSRELYTTEIELMSGAMDDALRSPHWNWTKEMNQIKDAEHLSWEQRCYFLSELYTAGHLTVAASVNIFLLLSAQNPNAVRRAQYELATVVGTGRLPGFGDIPHLPYVRAFMQEVLRCRPLIPTGIPHAVSKDDEYMGYRIPSDAFILPTHLCMNMDADLYQNPGEFRPERWLENPNLPLAAFGFGRRSCPGERMGRNSFFIVVARCLWAFEFVEQPLPSSSPSRGYNIVNLPAPVTISLQVRSPAHQAVIENSWTFADKDDVKLLAQVQESFKPKTSQ